MNKKNIARLKELYTLAKSAKVGEKITCPSCKTSFEKKQHQQAFCKSNSGTKCKDLYWNNVTETKRNNTERISPASAAWQYMNDTPIIFGYGDSQRALDKEDRYYNELEDDQSWVNHQCFVERCEWCGCINCRCD